MTTESPATARAGGHRPVGKFGQLAKFALVTCLGGGILLFWFTVVGEFRDAPKVVTSVDAPFPGTVSHERAPQGKALVLLTNLPAAGDARDGLLVALQEPGSNGCRFFGTLTQIDRPDTPVSDKMVSLALESSTSWTISINRQTCGNLETQVSMTVDMPRLWAGDFSAGRQVIARQL